MRVAVVVVWLCHAAHVARALIPLTPTTLMRARGLPPPTTSTAKPLEQHTFASALDAWAPALDAWARNANDLVREMARASAAAAPDAALAAFFFVLRCIPYTALVFSAWRLLDGSGTLELVGPAPTLPAGAEAFLGAEALFYVLRQGQIALYRAQPTSSDPPVMSRDERLALWRRVLEAALSAHGSVDGWVESWFLEDAKPRDAELQRADVARFISRGVFGVSPMELTDSEALDLAKMLAMLERRLTKPLVGDHEPSPEIERLLASSRADAAVAASASSAMAAVRMLRSVVMPEDATTADELRCDAPGGDAAKSGPAEAVESALKSAYAGVTRAGENLVKRQKAAATHDLRFVHWRPLRAVSHPLLVYGIVGVAKAAYAAALKRQGWTYHQAGRLRYWHRPAATTSSGPPIAFVHGIGIGLLPYLAPISQLAESGRACFLVEVPAVSLDMTERLPPAADVAADIERMLADHDDDGAVFIGHSFGSVYLSHVVQHAPHAILGAVFVEPVVFLLSLRNVLDQFLYAPCDPVMELVRTDPGVARALRRDFWWMEAALWREQLGVAACRERVAVFLADFDDVVPSAEVRRFLEAPQPPPLVTNMLERILGQVATSAPDGLADAIEEAQAMAGDTSLAASAAIEVHSWPLGHGRWEYDPKVSQRVVDKALELADQVETHGSL